VPLKTSHTLQQLALGVSAADLRGAHNEPAALPNLTAQAQLLVDYDYTPGRLATLYLPNGDPGDEPGEQECLEILRIESAQPLQFMDATRGVLVTLLAGRDLRPYFTDSALIAMELALLKEVRAAADEARIDAHLGGAHE
jgi:hypothetical protein